MKKAGMSMRGLGLFAVLLVLFCGVFFVDRSHAGTMDLIATLVDALGITEKQAEGGTGALFKNAKENLSTEDFQKVSEAVPGVDDYMAKAPSTDSKSGGGGLLSSGLSSLGGGASKLGGMASLTQAFSQLGMNTGTMGKFIPIVVKFVDSEAGSQVAGLLKNLWQ